MKILSITSKIVEITLIKIGAMDTFHPLRYTYKYPSSNPKALIPTAKLAQVKCFIELVTLESIGIRISPNIEAIIATP